MWIGLLWYFNFVQIPNMGKIPDEQKPAIGKVIAPAALFYFRWAAALTVLSGLILAYLNGYLHDAMTLSIGSGIPKHTAIGIGMWLGVIMAFNVWFVIWPNQKRALGIVECEPELKAKSAKTAMLFSRTNTLLSLPMLLAMVAAKTFINFLITLIFNFKLFQTSGLAKASLFLILLPSIIFLTASSTILPLLVLGISFT